MSSRILSLTRAGRALLLLLGAALLMPWFSVVQAQEVESEEMICKDLGDIFCFLEEFSKNLESSSSLPAKIGPGLTPVKEALEKTVIDLQANRVESRLSLKESGLPQEIRWINLNPGANTWFLLRLEYANSKAEWYHLENPEPTTQFWELLNADPEGLTLRKANGERELCELWTKSSNFPLRQAKQQNAPFVPLCKKSLYLRNRIEGYRTTKEWVVEFLRANVWGGETITNLVKETVFKDNWLMKSDPVGQAKKSENAELAEGPAPARLAPSFRGELVPTPELGIALQAVTDENLELGRWYKSQRQEAVYISVIEPKAIDEEILRSHREYVKDLDAVELEAQAVMVAFDMSKMEMSFAVGTDHPAVGWSERVIPEIKDPLLKGPDGFDQLDPLAETGIIPPYLSERVVGIFTGGFKRDHGAFRWGDLSKKNFGSHYGFLEHGVVLSSLVPSLATLTVNLEGQVDMKTWTPEDQNSVAKLRFARQNGVAIIEWNETLGRGVPGRLVSNWTLGNWSGSQDRKFRSLRAGTCLLEKEGKRFILYGYFSSTTPSGMARVFQAYGCRYAMHLDMNALEHTYLSLYAKNKAKDNAPQHLIKGMKVLDERFKGNVPRYIGYPDNRDFFYFLDKTPPAAK